MLERLRKIYRRQAFFPSAVGLFINPFFLARSALRDAMKECAPQLSGRLLDVGCGTKPYRELFNVSEYVGLDIDNELTRDRGIADYFYDGTHFPFEDESFDAVLCNQVLEHVFNPDGFLLEIRRVLRPGGKLLLTVPFVWDEHEQPYDYARYSSFGLEALIQKQGLKVTEHRKLRPDASTLFQMINAYLYKISWRWPMVLRLLFTALVMAPVSLLGVVLGKVLPGNPDLYLDNVVLAIRPA